MPLRLVDREEWGAKKPLGVEPMPLPAPCVMLKYYTRTEPCTGDKECKSLLKKLQLEHMTVRFYPDIKYNFLIGGDGTVYEGRGWLAVSTKQDFRFMDYYWRSIDIAFVGDFQDKPPPLPMQKAAMDLINYGVNSNFIERNYELIENKVDTIMPFDPGYEEAYASEHKYYCQPF